MQCVQLIPGSRTHGCEGHDPWTRTVQLPTGTLSVAAEPGVWTVDDLCGFAARQNWKRGFLFVSRVLGKHLPVRPSTLRDVYAHLAALIPATLPGPVLVVGMAETAVALGQGIHDAYATMHPAAEVVFMHSTRYTFDRPLATTFREEHSHAVQHALYLPDGVAPRATLAAARSLVLVDDEASTGQTFANLTTALRQVCPLLETVVCATLTDWCGAQRREALKAALGVPQVFHVSLLRGGYTFEPAPQLPHVAMPDIEGTLQLMDEIAPRDYGRFGGAPDRDRIRALAATVKPEAGENILVLGTGEFAYAPLLLAEALEDASATAFVQSTTRSPILVGDAIETALSFTDNYGEGIPNFLYNVRPGQYDRVVVCHETPPGSVDAVLTDALGAQTLAF